MRWPSDSVRIRKGLTFLRKADRKAIQAAVILQKLLGLADPAGPGALMNHKSFSVEGTPYKGWMTDGQYNYLKGYQGTKKKFADAIARVLVKLDAKIKHALQDIDQAIEMRSGTREAALGGIIIPPDGCCTYDSGMTTECSQAVCLLGLAGTSWVIGPCGQGNTRRG